MHLEYEIIESEDLAERVRGEYNIGRSLGYDYTTLLKTLPWSKDNTREVRREYSAQKHEGGGVVVHEEECGRQ